MPCSAEDDDDIQRRQLITVPHEPAGFREVRAVLPTHSLMIFGLTFFVLYLIT